MPHKSNQRVNTAVTFSPGTANKSGGKPKNGPWKAAIRRQMKLHPDMLDEAAKVLLESAVAGKLDAIKELGDRLDGKAMQRNEHTGEGGGPLVVEIVRFGKDTATE